ncbi:MAG: glycosyltransferase family 4 protein [Anaerolineae bacterium]
MVSARYYPFTGGTETHVYEVARRLAADGQSVTILTTDPEGTLPHQETAAGVQICRVRAYPRQRDYYFAPGILPTVIRGGWDVVHIQGYHTFVAPLAMLAAWISRTPYVVTFHSGGHSSAARNRMRSFQRRLLSPLLKHADQLIGVSEFEADFFAQSLGIDRSRFIVVPNGSHLPPLEEPITPDEEPLIVSSGRLERYKGHHHVIAALAELLKIRPDVRLRIVGTGPYEPELQTLIDTLGVRDHVEIGAIPSG